jgi:hypothetical protein
MSSFLKLYVMSLSIYLSTLKPYDDIPQIAAIFEKASLAFASTAIKSESIDALRGQLLRTLDEIIHLKTINITIWQGLSTSVWTFFSSTKSCDLVSLSSDERQQIEDIVIKALQILANDYPVDDVDPIDLTPIQHEEPHLLSITGRKYRLTNLVEWIKTRKDFIYPDVNKPMFSQDIKNLKHLSQEYGLSLEPAKQYSTEIQSALAELGLSVEAIENLHVPQLRLNHINALQVLICEYGHELNQAIAEIQSLNYEQVDALVQLYQVGLRGAHLRSLHIDESEYGPHHTVVLHILTQEQGYDIDKAINTITDCDFDEVQEFYSRRAYF